MNIEKRQRCSVFFLLWWSINNKVYPLQQDLKLRRRSRWTYQNEIVQLKYWLDLASKLGLGRKRSSRTQMNVERWRSNCHPSLVFPLSRKAVTFLIKTKMENLWTLIYLHSFHRILNLTFGARQKWCSRPEKKRKSSVLDRNWILYDKTMLLNISKMLSAYTIWR